MTDLQQLHAPFPPDKVSWRVGSTNKDKTKGMALAFIDARDVMERLDRVCGLDGWQNRYPHANGKTVCEIGVRVGDEWIWKANGAGDTDVEAEKGALSDAFKRAAVLWGVGRYLYDLPSPWVEIEPMGRSYRIKPSEQAKLDQVTRGAVVQFDAAVAEDSAFVNAATVAINLCRDEADLTAWSAANKAALDEASEAERAAVRKVYSAHLRNMKKAA